MHSCSIQEIMQVCPPIGNIRLEIVKEILQLLKFSFSWYTLPSQKLLNSFFILCIKACWADIPIINNVPLKRSSYTCKLPTSSIILCYGPWAALFEQLPAYEGLYCCTLTVRLTAGNQTCCLWAWGHNPKARKEETFVQESEGNQYALKTCAADVLQVL